MLKIFKSQAITHNFEHAQQALILARKILSTKYDQEIINKITQMRSIPIAFPEYSLEWIQEVAKQTKLFQVGNCCEKSCVAFEYLIHQPELFNSNIELWNNPFSDHFFVIIGRDPKTSESDPNLWNKKSIFCDPLGENRIYFMGDALQQNILTSTQNGLVLRSRSCAGVFESFNLDVPMCYEEWDLEDLSHSPP